MLSFFKKTKNSLIGVDFDCASLSLVELMHHNTSITLKNYNHSLYLQQESEQDETTATKNQFLFLKSSLKKNNFFSTSAVTAVPDSSIISKQITVDASLSEKEIETQVYFEAEKIIPYPLEEVALDFIKKEVDPCDNEKIKVVIVACRKVLVDSKEDLLLMSGLQPKIIDVVSYGMERAFSLIKNQVSLSSPKDPVAIIHMGDEFLTLNVLKHEKSFYIRTTTSGIKKFILNLVEEHKIPHYEALKCLANKKDTKIKKTLECFQYELSHITNQLLEQFYSSKHDSYIGHAIICGNTIATQEKFLELLQKKSNIPCKAANPFSDMNMEQNINKKELDQIAPQLFVACGLAMRGN